LSNITAPPFLLAEHSTVEIPQYSANHPKLFVAPALAKTPEERALRILKWFLGSLKNQQYAGQDPSDGVKKPLNAFLGELFLGSFKDEEAGETRLVSEQVSHHPPVTACYLRNDKYGVTGHGFTCQEITFSGNVSIKQKGYAIQHLDEYDEDYLTPVPNVKIKGVVSGSPYPELSGKYSIPSSTGFVSEIKFEGKGLLGGGTKNGVEARIYHVDAPSDDIYTVTGSWAESFTVHDVKAGKDIERYVVDAERSIRLNVPDVSEQDPWETGKAWADLREALRRGDMKGTSDAKAVIEEGQRGMRAKEESNGTEWQQVFFRREKEDPVFKKLCAMVKDDYDVDYSGGIWEPNVDAIANTQRPFHGGVTPAGKQVGNTSQNNSTMSNGNGHVGNANQDKPTMGNGSVSGQAQIHVQPSERPKDKPQQASTDSSTEMGIDEKTQIEDMLRAKYSSTAR
jgi:hypothetical protein